MTKTFPRFALGIRFGVRSGCETPAEALRILTGCFPPDVFLGTVLFGCLPPASDMDPEPVCICVVAGLSLTASQRLYDRVRRSPRLTAHLTIYRPYVQNNYLERCTAIERFGTVLADGTLWEGEELPEAGRLPAPGGAFDPNRPVVRLLLAPSARTDRSLAAVCREAVADAARAFPEGEPVLFPVSEGGAGTVDAMVCLNGGKYGRFPAAEGAEGVRYGVLPDDAAVAELSDGGAVEAGLACGRIRALAEAGFRTVYLASAFDPPESGWGEGLAALGVTYSERDTAPTADLSGMPEKLRGVRLIALSDRCGVTDALASFLWIERADALETLLQRGQFVRRAREVSAVLTEGKAPSPVFAASSLAGVPCWPLAAEALSDLLPRVRFDRVKLTTTGGVFAGRLERK